MNEKEFTEVTVTDGFGEFMVHLDSDGNPIRMYTYVEDIGSWPKDRSYDEDEAEWTEREILDRKNYKKGKNPLFVYAKDKNWIVRIWNAYLRNFASEEDMEQFQ